MSREQAIARAERYFDDGGFFADLGRRVAIPTESQNPDRRAELARYLTGEMQPSFERLGFRCRVLDNPAAGLIKTIPSVWDETIVLPSSEIGEVAAFARRRGEVWFVGIMNG